MQWKRGRIARKILVCYPSYYKSTCLTANKFYTKCDHEPYSREGSDERQWLTTFLKKVIEVPQLVKDLAKMNENVFTTYLEVFHSLKIKY